MKIYKTQEEIERDIVDGVLTVNGDVKFECSFSISASINVVLGNINARNINAVDINAVDINAGDINARNINAGDINAWDINARNINAVDINAVDINAVDINAVDINARNILYHAFCCVYKSISCLSIKAKREKHHEPICLDGEITYKQKDEEVQEMTVEEVSKLVGKKVKIVE